jgi:hypothetical protein
MVKGLDKFREYFREFTGQYVLIGGAACDISFRDQGEDFRATRDLDIVLIVEAQTKEFGERFWNFIDDGGYQHRARSSGEPQFYRFDKPASPDFPKMLELFARTNWILNPDAVLTPVHIDDSVSSLSAILLNDAYYQALLRGREIIDGVSLLKPSWIIPFKAKAWLDLLEKQRGGLHVDSRDIKKHRNDIIRITAEMVLEKCKLTGEIRSDMQRFIQELNVTNVELKNLGLEGVTSNDIKRTLEETYL